MQIQLEKAKELFLKIYNDTELAGQIEIFLLDNNKVVEKYLVKGEKKNWKGLLKKDGFTKLCVCVAFLPIVKEKYLQKGISDEIFFDTMSDIKVWIDDAKQFAGKAGLDEMNWIINHLNLEIFKLGRLQFQLSKYYFGALYSSGNLKVKFGDKCLNIHIPRGGNMDIQECKKSVELAKEFFAKFYPNYTVDYFICHSWLLYEGNKNFVDEGSNIAKFASQFTIVGCNNEPAQTLRWLFETVGDDAKLIKNKLKNAKYIDFDKLPTKTSMQQKAIQYLKDGGEFGEGRGILIC